MPNWNYNTVEIHAPKAAVMAWLVPQHNKGEDVETVHHYLFHMHKLFSEHVPESDPT